MSSSGKTQHFDCCIRRFESCHPSQKQQTQFCVCCFLFSFSAGFEPTVHLLQSKRDIKIVASDKACLVGFCHPSQKQQMHFCTCCFLFRLFGRIRTDSPSFAKQKGHKIVASDKACLVGFCHPSHVVASCISLAAIFLSPRTHSAAPPFRNRSRSSRLFGCKRPHNGFVSLPPCFGLLLVFQIHFCICCFFV